MKRKKSSIVFEPAAAPQTRDFKMLIAIPSPRDIPQFRECVDKYLQQYDKVWFKYFAESDNPYTLIKEYFLSHWKSGKKYTHLAILPDDIITNKEGIDKLVANVKSDPEKYKVMMGTFPIYYGSEELALCPNLPSLVHSNRRYEFYKKQDVKGKGIISVGWCGTPFAILRGDLLADGIVSLDNDINANPNVSVGGSQDVVLANELAEHNIPIYVDTDVYFIHLKGLPIADVNLFEYAIKSS